MSRSTAPRTTSAGANHSRAAFLTPGSPTSSPTRQGSRGCPSPGPTDARVEVWADANFGFWQVYTGEDLPVPLRRRSLAVEPMTAAPNAFQTGWGLRRLEPGESVTSRWGARLR